MCRSLNEAPMNMLRVQCMLVIGDEVVTSSIAEGSVSASRVGNERRGAVRMIGPGSVASPQG